MTLIAIALFGLLFIAVFGAKAAKGFLKFIGAVCAFGISVVVVIVLYGASRVPTAAPAQAAPSTVTATNNAQQCEAWRAAVPPCGIPIRNATGIGTLPEPCRTPDTDDLPRARTIYAGFQGLHGLEDHEAIAWLMRLQEEFVKLTPGKRLSPISPSQTCPVDCAQRRANLSRVSVDMQRLILAPYGCRF